MKSFDKRFIDINFYVENHRKPDFNNILKVLRREKPERPTLFEFFMSDVLYKQLTAGIKYDENDPLARFKRMVDAFRLAGYDYVTMHGTDMRFGNNDVLLNGKKSISLNEGAVVFNRESFENYCWPDFGKADYSRLDKLEEYLPEGMKIIVYGPKGVLENVTALVGYENLCYMISDEPELVMDIFNEVGSRILKYYEICSAFESVGALISNDDWGFNTQTMLSAGDMRKYVIPWHKKIVDKIHSYGKPAILHSCGMLDDVMNDIIEVIGCDAKHSFEDKIKPVEQAYKELKGRIAVLGGMDLNFICNSTPEEIYNRSSAMLELASQRGGYALGSGNSIPDYVPVENYFAMISAAVFA